MENMFNTSGRYECPEKRGAVDDMIHVSAALIFLMKRLWIIVLAGIIAGLGFFTVSKLFVTPTFRSGFTAYVNNKSQNQSSDVALSNSDIMAAQELVHTYSKIITGNSVLTASAETIHLDAPYSELSKMVRTELEDDTEIIRVYVVDKTPEGAYALAEAIAKISPEYVSEIVVGSSMKIIDKPQLPTGIYQPNYLRTTVLGAFVGVLVSVIFFLISFYRDDTVKNESELERRLNIPVVGVIPDISGKQKFGAQFDGYSDLDAEAYKTLRTNIAFSLPDNECKCIGITGANRGDGKSFVAVKLAGFFAQLKKRVLLIDCDMRLPTVASKLGIEPKPGLSDYLTGKTDNSISIKRMKSLQFDVMTAGDIPPDPTALLASKQTENLFDWLKKHYDYIIVDFPSVRMVSDAAILSRVIDGYLIVVRHESTEFSEIAEAMRRLDFADARVIGCVYNGKARGMFRKKGKRYDCYKRGKI